MHAQTYDTPIGPLTALIDNGDVVHAMAFSADVDWLRERLPGPRQAEPVHAGASGGPVATAVAAYFAGDVKALDGLAAEQDGSPFFRRAWQAMRDVPAGETISYTELAARAGAPRAVRAAGTACARNLIAPLIPCHRIVRSDGTHGGYAYGLPTKAWLIRHEREALGGAGAATLFG
jgi:methylated-DNA-[protein]-cysteine S-methyltransferase